MRKTMLPQIFAGAGGVVVSTGLPVTIRACVRSKAARPVLSPLVLSGRGKLSTQTNGGMLRVLGMTYGKWVP